MKLLFCLFNYFPYGGLQKDCLNLANECVSRGHEVCILTAEWQGPLPENIKVDLLNVRAFTNDGWVRKFIQQAKTYFNCHAYDLIVGFNRMPGLDVYYAADPCYKEIFQSLPWYKKILPRYRNYLAVEAQLFANRNLYVCALTPQAQTHFVTHYAIKKENVVIVPLQLDATQYSLTELSKDQKQQLKRALQWDPARRVILFVGSQFKTKGLARALKAIASLPVDLQKKLIFAVVGDDDRKPYQALMTTLQCDVRFLGSRDDVPKLLQASDLLLHPALLENTGTVLLEAMACALPILTTDICGFAPYIQQAHSGEVLPSPFDQAQLNQRLLQMLTDDLTAMGHRGIVFCREHDITAPSDNIVNLLETLDPHPVRLL